MSKTTNTSFTVPLTEFVSPVETDGPNVFR